MSIIGNPLLLGGGKSNIFAFIVVTYPAGSTLTATNGTKTMTAGDTSGTWVFEIPEAGTWTLVITDGTDTATMDVIIYFKGQGKEVELSYRISMYYQEVEYIYHSDSLAFIDVDFIGSSNSEYDFYIQLDTASGDIKYLGNYTMAFGTINGKWRLGGVRNTGSLWETSNNNSTTSKVHVYSSGHVFNIDGVEKTFSVPFDSPNVDNFRVFGSTYGNFKGTKAKIFGDLILKDNGIVKRKLIPCYRKSDNVIGLYNSAYKPNDQSTGQQFYTNSVGTLIAGPDVN